MNEGHTWRGVRRGGEEEIKKKEVASNESDQRVWSDRFAHVPAEIPDLPRSREDRAYYSPKLPVAVATLICVRASVVRVY